MIVRLLVISRYARRTDTDNVLAFKFDNIVGQVAITILKRTAQNLSLYPGYCVMTVMIVHITLKINRLGFYRKKK